MSGQDKTHAELVADHEDASGQGASELHAVIGDALDTVASQEALIDSLRLVVDETGESRWLDNAVELGKDHEICDGDEFEYLVNMAKGVREAHEALRALLPVVAS